MEVLVKGVNATKPLGMEPVKNLSPFEKQKTSVVFQFVKPPT